MTMRMNLGKRKPNTRMTFTDWKLSLSSDLFDSVKLYVDLTCPICLDTVFNVVSLRCGHILCYMCACSAASVSIVDGLEAADHDRRCRLCRESRECPEYRQQRFQPEIREQLKKMKEYYESLYICHLRKKCQ